MSRTFTSFRDFSRHIKRVAARLPRETDRALATIGREVTTLAKAKIGVLQGDVTSPEGFYFPAWEPLSGSTVAQKEALGFSPPDYAPLLRYGDMRASIGYTVAGGWHAESVTVGATDPVAAYQEFGTSRGIPPRPFIGASMAEHMNDNLRTLLLAVARSFEAA